MALTSGLVVHGGQATLYDGADDTHIQHAGCREFRVLELLSCDGHLEHVQNSRALPESLT